MTFDGPPSTVIYVYGDPAESEHGIHLPKRPSHFSFRDIPAAPARSDTVSVASPGTALRGAAPSSRAYDPYAVHRDFPDRWSTYIRTNFRNLNHIVQVFGVSERTARSWWKGETGANGGYVAIAVRERPVAAPRMLFAAE